MEKPSKQISLKLSRWEDLGQGPLLGWIIWTTYPLYYADLVEIEGVLNRQPLTYLDEDDIEEPLTPIHLYCGHRILNSIEGEGYESDTDFNNTPEQALSWKHQLEQVLHLSPSMLEKRLFIRVQINTHRKQNWRKQYQNEWHSNRTWWKSE